jgi:uncharacterized membrane protein YcaP (DUF421 family)
MFQSMFHMQLPLLEKILRPMIVYLFLIILLRVFGKRELAQLNPFDLVVLLSLANTVQNAIIGNDNSLTGGLVGALALLAINWVLMRVLYKAPKLTAILEGTATVLVKDGKVVEDAMKKEIMTPEELVSVLNKNGFDDPADVALCILEPNGTVYVKGKSPSSDEQESSALMDEVQKLSRQIAELRAELKARP